jgi:hypothetical protein
MGSDATILELLRNAFSSCQRPEHFTNYEHCSECRNHDDVLRSRDINTLAIEDVGNSGWDPICYISPEGFAYYFPALARLALEDETERFGWYGPQLLFHLTHDGQCSLFLPHLRPEQKQAVVALLRHIGETRQDQLANYGYVEELQTAIDRWSGGEPFPTG